MEDGERGGRDSPNPPPPFITVMLSYKCVRSTNTALQLHLQTLSGNRAHKRLGGIIIIEDVYYLNLHGNVFRYHGSQLHDSICMTRPTYSLPMSNHPINEDILEPLVNEYPEDSKTAPIGNLNKIETGGYCTRLSTLNHSQSVIRQQDLVVYRYTSILVTHP